MIVTKSLKIPVHYAATKAKLDKLDKLTARIANGIRLTSSFITNETEPDRKIVRKIVKDNEIAEKTGLSAGFVDQIVDKVIWSWRSYKKLHKDWERRVNEAQERVDSADDDRKREKAEKSLDKLIKREPSIPKFQKKTPCRIDYRTGRIEWGRNSFILWMHISTLQKNKPMDVPLNPSHYHLKQLEGSEIDDFEIIKHDKKYYAHISISREIPERPTSSVGGIDQGMNRTIATVLLPVNGLDMPHEGLICDSERRDLIDKYDDILASLQKARIGRKLKKLRNRRTNVAVYHDWCLANHVARSTVGYYIVIGNAHFHQTNIRGNGKPELRKRVGKWSYSRQRQYIALKRAEMGYPTKLVDERYTSKTCHRCGSKLVERKWLDGSSYILCHSCKLKYDADLNAAHNIALRCKDDWLKVQMTSVENRASA
jgi:putative transposase